MKKVMIVILLLIGVACLTACGEGVTKVEISTAKSGKIDVSVFGAEGAKETLTPLVTTEEKSITDDGYGLYLVSVGKTGEGDVSLSQNKAEAGATVTVNATPSASWKLGGIFVNDSALPQGTTSFVMPAKDTTVNVVFEDLRHAAVVGDHIVVDWGEPRDDYYSRTAYSIVAGERYEFAIDYREEGHYYEDKDVVCHSFDGAEVAVTKVGEGRYAFVAPDSDCDLAVETHEYRSIGGVKVFTSTYDWGIYDEQDRTDLFTVGIAVDGRPYTFGETAKDNAEVRIALSADSPFRVTYIFKDNYHNYTLNYDKDGVTGEYTFTLDFSTQELGIRIEWTQQMRAITVNNPEHGTISAPTVAAPDAQVTVTVTPDENYSLGALRYSYEQDVWQNIAAQNDAYVFTMPDADVTIAATFENTPYDAGGFHVYVQAPPEYGEEFSLTEVVAELFVYINGDMVETALADNLTLPVDAEDWLNMEIRLKEGYGLQGIYLRNTDVTTFNAGDYGAAECGIGEEDLGDCIVIVVVRY